MSEGPTGTDRTPPFGPRARPLDPFRMLCPLCARWVRLDQWPDHHCLGVAL